MKIGVRKSDEIEADIEVLRQNPEFQQRYLLDNKLHRILGIKAIVRGVALSRMAIGRKALLKQRSEWI